MPERKKNRLDGYDYSSRGAYFVTVCLAGRKPLLWNAVGADSIRPEAVPLSEYGRIVQQAIEAIPSHYERVSVDTYCIMPDHLHILLVLSPEDDGRMLSAPTVSGIVGSMKRWTSRQIGVPIWQKSFYDRVVRDESDYRDIWQYIADNPRKFK